MRSVSGIKCSAVICREVEDASQVLHDLQSSGVQVICRPGQMRPDQLSRFKSHPNM